MEGLGGLIVNLRQLEKCCSEAEEFAKKTGDFQEPSFNVNFEAIRTNPTVRISPGLSGANLGLFQENGVYYTRVNLKCKKVRKFLSGIKEKL